MPPKMTPRRLQRWTSSDRPLHYRLSESESDDNFIVFDGINSKSVSTDNLIGCDFGNVRKTYARQRQISECSDDFICFEYDENDALNYLRSDERTDDEFTESDDSDDESSDAGSDECDFKCENDCVFIVNKNPPDSGFEEKKVSKTFHNLILSFQQIFVCANNKDSWALPKILSYLPVQRLCMPHCNSRQVNQLCLCGTPIWALHAFSSLHSVWNIPSVVQYFVIEHFYY